MKWLLIGFVRAYQIVVSPLLGPTCRYYPSCSAYALQALREHGAVKGTWLAVRRLLRCHPWSPGGVDHVPARKHRHGPTPEVPSETLSESSPEVSPALLSAPAGSSHSQQGA